MLGNPPLFLPNLEGKKDPIVSTRSIRLIFFLPFPPSPERSGQKKAIPLLSGRFFRCSFFLLFQNGKQREPPKPSRPFFFFLPPHPLCKSLVVCGATVTIALFYLLFPSLSRSRKQFDRRLFPKKRKALTPFLPFFRNIWSKRYRMLPGSTTPSPLPSLLGGKV